MGCVKFFYWDFGELDLSWVCKKSTIELDLLRSGEKEKLDTYAYNILSCFSIFLYSY